MFTDKLTFDGLRKTKDGYLVASPRVARAGIQLYSGAEVGKPEMQTVRVYRPPEEVFNTDAMNSYAYRPVTVGHPGVKVTADNWSDLTRGMSGSEVVRDGDFIRVPMAIMDAKAIQSVEDGTIELSMGYEANIQWGDGVTPNGEKYDAIQKDMRMNHLAIVSSARGGSHLRIGDETSGEDTMKVMVDGISIEASEQAAQVIEKLQNTIRTTNDSVIAKDAKIAELTTAVGTKDGEIAILKKQVTDAQMTPAQLDAAVKDRQTVIDAAKKIGGDKIVVDGKTIGEIKKAAVAVVLGDAANAMEDAAINGAFALAAASAAKITTTTNDGSGTLRNIVAIPPVNNTDAAAKARQAYLDSVTEMQNAYRTPVKAA